MEASDQSLWGWAIFILLLIDVMIFVGGYYLGRLYRDRSAIVAPVSVTPQAVDETLASALDQGLSSLSERLRSIEGRLFKLCNDSPARQMETVEGDKLQYAARMAERGNSIEELMAVCNLGRGEAELIKLLHDGRETEPHHGAGAPT